MTKKVLFKTVSIDFVDGTTLELTDQESSGVLNMCASQAYEAVMKHHDVTVKGADGVIHAIVIKNVKQARVTASELHTWEATDVCA